MDERYMKMTDIKENTKWKMKRNATKTYMPNSHYRKVQKKSVSIGIYCAILL